MRKARAKATAVRPAKGQAGQVSVWPKLPRQLSCCTRGRLRRAGLVRGQASRWASGVTACLLVACADPWLHCMTLWPGRSDPGQGCAAPASAGGLTPSCAAALAPADPGSVPSQGREGHTGTGCASSRCGCHMSPASLAVLSAADSPVHRCSHQQRRRRQRQRGRQRRQRRRRWLRRQRQRRRQ